MIWVLFICATLCLGELARQDWKTRKVSVLWLGAFFLVTVMLSFQFSTSEQFLWQSGTNLIILAIHLVVLWLYVSIKNRKAVAIHKKHFGLGDILFLVACTPAFPPFIYVFLIMLTALFAIVGTLIIKRIREDVSSEIPFVSYGAVVYLILLSLTVTNYLP